MASGGLRSLNLHFDSPITALSALNGTGKSTIAQLAVCGYRELPAGSLRRFYVRGFFPVSAAACACSWLTSRAAAWLQGSSPARRPGHRLTTGQANRRLTGLGDQTHGGLDQLAGGSICGQLPVVEPRRGHALHRLQGVACRGGHVLSKLPERVQRSRNSPDYSTRVPIARACGIAACGWEW
jgi:hypothetical protein